MVQLFDRKILEYNEKELLAPFAVKNSETRGRRYVEPKDKYKLSFVIDRERVIHSKAFRRLRGKTQVFLASKSDHFRNRLTHTIEVAQIARTLARMLGLNEDLSETIALAHDIGHPPFGHAGEKVMNQIMFELGSGFEHNIQSRRVVEKIEKISYKFSGLNLTFETLEGLDKHGSFSSGSDNFLFLESQIVDFADQIAYQIHDLEDVISSNLVDMDEIKKLTIWRRVEDRLSLNLALNLNTREIIYEIMEILVEDLAINTAKKLIKQKIDSPLKVAEYKEKIASFSDNIDKENKELREFLYKNFYRNPVVLRQMENGQKIVKKLFWYCYKNTYTLPVEFVSLVKKGEDKGEIIKDYIVGMTDSFALQKFNSFGLSL